MTIGKTTKYLWHRNLPKYDNILFLDNWFAIKQQYYLMQHQRLYCRVIELGNKHVLSFFHYNYWEL